jgi:glucose-1-phosphate cytidylyltransferase
MVHVVPRPLLWHVMRYYAHFGYKDFILCLGYGGHHIKQYFLDYQETASNDFVLQGGRVELHSSDIADWSIAFVDTGLESPIAERLRRVRRLLEGEEMFLANYADVLTDALIDAVVAVRRHPGRRRTAPCGARRRRRFTWWFHVVEVDDGNLIEAINALKDMRLQENGGYLVLRQEVFDYLPENGDLIVDACAVLAKEGRLAGYPYHGFWQPADTLKERVALEAMYQAGHTPWMPWRTYVPKAVSPVLSAAPH